MNNESYTLGDDKFTNDNLYYGKIGEQVINTAIRKAFPEWTVEHNPFGSQYQYACAHGIDLTATNSEHLPIYAEVKNLKQQNKPYGTDFVNRHVLPRFEGLYGVKVLFITFIALLTENALYLLKRNGISIIEIGERLTTEFFKHYEKVYQLANRIKRLVQPKSKALFSSHYTLNQLTNYCTPSSANTNIEQTEQHVVEQRIEQHDTVYNDKEILEELKTVVRPIYVEWLRYKCDMEEDD